jgi:hypothetical protein
MLLYEATGAGALVALVSDPTQVTPYHQKDTGRGTLLLLRQCQAQNAVVIAALIFCVAPYIHTLAGPTCPPLPTPTSTCTFGAAGAVTSVLKIQESILFIFCVVYMFTLWVTRCLAPNTTLCLKGYHEVGTNKCIQPLQLILCCMRSNGASRLRSHLAINSPPPIRPCR